MSRASVVVVAVLVTAALLAGVVAAEPAATRSGAATVGGVAASTGGATDAGLDRPDPQTVIEINVTRNGDATVAVESRFEVNGSDENETRAFETLYRDVRDGDVELLYDASTMRNLVGDVSAATDREMAVENPRWTRSVRNGTGVIALRFEWTNFGLDRSETVVVGDAFQTGDGSWLPTLADGQRLVLAGPDGYTVLSPSDSVGQERMTWDGPREFQAGSPSVTFGGSETTPGTPPGGTTATTPGGTTAATTPGGAERDGSALFWVALLVVVLSVGGGGYWYFSEQDGGAAAGAASTDDESATDTPAPTPDDADGEETDATGDADADGDDGDDAGGAIDPELLSDEERVEHLLEQNGGRMKQAQIVKETGWSNAKVSQLLSSMDDEDRIDKLRIGRENLITLPDEDVTDI